MCGCVIAGAHANHTTEERKTRNSREDALPFLPIDRHDSKMAGFLLGEKTEQFDTCVGRNRVHAPCLQDFKLTVGHIFAHARPAPEAPTHANGGQRLLTTAMRQAIHECVRRSVCPNERHVEYARSGGEHDEAVEGRTQS